jgi:hypothetical protein
MKAALSWEGAGGDGDDEEGELEDDVAELIQDLAEAGDLARAAGEPPVRVVGDAGQRAERQGRLHVAW